MEYRTYNENMDIVRKYQNPDFVDVETLAEELGMKVCYSKQPDNISGAIFKNEKIGGSRGYVCFVNSKHTPERQRFTIAHETAHFILHRDYIGDGITDNGLLRSNLSSEIEIAANRLAADIIMPWHLISHALKNGRENNELAKVLKVSNGAMSIRLETPFEG